MSGNVHFVLGCVLGEGADDGTEGEETGVNIFSFPSSFLIGRGLFRAS